MSRYVDRLIAASESRLDTRMAYIRQECIASMDMSRDPEKRMTHYYLQESANQACAEMPHHIVEASYGLYRPISPQYSLESSGGLTYFALGHGEKLSVIACSETKTYGFAWLSEINSDTGRLTKENAQPLWNNKVDPSTVLQTDNLSAVNVVWRVYCMLSLIMTVPGLFIPEHRKASEKLQAARSRRGKQPLVEYVNLDIARPKVATLGSESCQRKVQRIRHQVIGHYRLLTANRPEPQLSFVRSHWRGNSDAGTRVKDYTVSDSGIGFAPPSIEVAA